MISQNPISVAEISKKFPHLVQSIMGDQNSYFIKIAPTYDCDDKSLCYVTSDKYFKLALQSLSAVIICSPNYKGEIPKDLKNKTWIISPNPELLVAFIKNSFILQTPYKNFDYTGIHPTAVIHPSAKIGKNAIVAPYSVISSHCEVGDNAFIGAHAMIESHVKIGAGSTIHPHCYIGHSCELGNNCEVMSHTTIGSEGFGYAHDEKGNHYRIPHTGKVIIGDNVHIGTHCSLDRGNMDNTIIASGTIIDNHCHFAHNTEVGEKSIITAFFTSAGSAKIGKYFIAGGRTSVGGHIKVCDGVNVAALTAINGNVEKPGKYGGYPLMPLQEYLKFRVNLGKLNEMRTQIKEILKKLKTD